MKIKTPSESSNERWDTLCEQGRIARTEGDNICWIVGGLASEVKKDYGANSIGKFAIEINMNKDTVRDYRRVYDFYEKDNRIAFMQECPFITFSHMRLAAGKLPDENTAYAFLVKANANRWTIEQAELALAPGKEDSGEDEVRSKMYDEVITMGLALEEIRAMSRSNPNKKIELVIYEFLTPEKPVESSEPMSDTKASASV